ncbi:hypothetical protein V1277_002858 [Bradyrhizobium sp. AZCC 1588]|uniref:hypothetical protein n=1 Tax=unclassified Bradyrhizobium TaxID=2631580 RepID=UPI002FEE8FDA
MSAKLKSSLKVSGSLIWPRFAPGIVLLDEDLTESIRYTRNLSRLLFRSLFGCGVICGFKVTARVECGNLNVTVAPGVALDCHGDPIEMCKPQTLGSECAEKLPEDLWIAIRRSGEHSCAPRDVVCVPEDGSSAHEPTRSKDCFEIKLFEEPPEGACMCTRPAMLLRDEAQGDAAAQRDVGSDLSAAKRSRTRRADDTAKQAAAAKSTDNAVRSVANATGTQQSDAGPEEWDWDCHRDHYCGECGCGCAECGRDCDCCCGEGWVILAKVNTQLPQDTANPNSRRVDHGVRRFIRPRLAADPMVNAALRAKCEQAGNDTTTPPTDAQPPII